jgi:hypothetical protein
MSSHWSREQETVKKSWSRTVALSAVFAAALAGSIANPSSATVESASHHHARGQKGGITPYAFRANSFGTNVVVNGVALKTVKDAQALQKCTRQLRGEIVKGSSLGTDGLLPIGNDLIHISPSTSRTLTYHAGDRYGVRATNLIADISVGGQVAGIQTPVLKIQGLESVADSFVDSASGQRASDQFGYASNFGFKGISLEIPTGNLPPELQQLLQIINQATTPINQVVNQVIQLLTQVGGTIQIPGLGSLGLGTKKGKATAHSAESSAYALKIEVDSPVDGSKTVIELGRATSRVSDSVPSGVFRTTMSALGVEIGGLLSFGGVSQTSIPCEGTNGKTKSKTVPAASIPGILSLSGVQYTWSGKQFSRGHGKHAKDKAKGFVQATIGQVSIPSAGLVINGLTSRVDMKSAKENAPVKSKAFTKVGSILLNGVPVAPLQPGQTLEFAGGVLKYAIRSNDSFYGTENQGLQVILFQDNVVINLASVNGQIFYR